MGDAAITKTNKLVQADEQLRHRGGQCGLSEVFVAHVVLSHQHGPQSGHPRGRHAGSLGRGGAEWREQQFGPLIVLVLIRKSLHERN